MQSNVSGSAQSTWIYVYVNVMSTDSMAYQNGVVNVSQLGLVVVL